MNKGIIYKKLREFIGLLSDVLSRRTIKGQLMIAMILVTIIPAIILNLFYYYKLNAFVDEKVESYNMEIVKQAGNKLDSMLEQVEILKRQLIAISVTSELFLNYEGKTPIEKLTTVKGTESVLSSMKSAFPYILDMYLIGVDGNVYSGNPFLNRSRLLEKDWIKSIGNIEFGEMVTTAHVTDYSDINNTGSSLAISFVKRINGYGDNRAIGMVQIDLKYDDIKKLMEDINIGEKGLVLLVDGDNNIIFSRDKRYIGESIGKVDFNGFNAGNTNGFTRINSDNKGFIVNHRLTFANWRLVGIIPTENFFMEAREVGNLTLLIAILSIIVSIILSIGISEEITKPITRIIKTMKTVGQGNFTVEFPKTSNADLQVLSNSLNTMISKIDILMKNTVINEKEKVNAELKALQAQINPHFLYNTLEVIRGIALANKVQSIVEISKSLAKLFRYSINRDNEVITIENEIEYVKNYIKILNYRYGNKLDVIYDIEEEAYKCKAIRLILQPIIENAVYHGVERKLGKGTIIIKCRIHEGCLLVEITDDGLGMANEQVESINRELEESTRSSEKLDSHLKGIGLKNVNARIKMNYGYDFGLKIRSQENVGTTVEVKIPSVYEEGTLVCSK